MRITGGTACGRKLAGPKGDRNQVIRPTSDRVREALFNQLGDLVRQATVLDFFAGTGALGLEALSRGAKTSIFVDSSTQALQLIHENLQHLFPASDSLLLRCRLDMPRTMQLLRRRLHSSLSSNLVFLDPPYQKNLAGPLLPMLEQSALLQPGATIVIEEHINARFAENIGSLCLIGRKEYGTTAIWRYTFRHNSLKDRT